MNYISIIIIVSIIRVIILNSDLLASWVNFILNQCKKLLGVKRLDGVFDNYFIEPKLFYYQYFGQIPKIFFINSIEPSEVIEKVLGNEYGLVKKVFQRSYYDWDDAQVLAGKTLLILEGKLLFVLEDNWVMILTKPNDEERAKRMINDFSKSKAKEKQTDYEMNIISIKNGSLDLKTLPIKPTTLDIDSYYNDDFKVVDTIIKQRLANTNDKGIVLLHGLPGTGKTTYLRHLIGSINKKVLFVSPSVANNLMNPEFMDLLIENPNAVLVIEDAENIIMDRKYSSYSSVSNLLNISDGLLSDCLNVQIICTFNSDLALVDSALLRKGRLIASYAFGKLTVEKAQHLSNLLGLNKIIDTPKTLAEITNTNEHVPETTNKQVIGFRRAFAEN